MGKNPLTRIPSQEVAPAAPEIMAYYAHSSRAESTLAAYGGDWARFVAWCERENLASLPALPATVAAYAIHLGRDLGQSIRYIHRSMAAIGWSHTKAGVDPPPTKHDAVKAVLKGVARKHGRPPKKKRALTGRDLRRLLEQCPAEDMTGKRDRALLSLGFFAALRRSELAALDCEDVCEIDGGLEVFLRHSKTDQEGRGEKKGVKQRRGLTDPVALLRAWRVAAGISAGPLFRAIDQHGHMAPRRLTDRSVALIIKRTCLRAGLDPGLYSGHSLRRGFATSAARGGADGLLIRQQTKHKSDRMVTEYVEEGTRLGRHAQDFIDTGDDDGET